MRDRIVKFFVTQKFRFDMSTQFMVFINFALLVITASPHIQGFLHNRFGVEIQINMIIPIFIALALFGVWLFGFTLDKLNYWQEIRTVQTYRNPIFVKILKKYRKDAGRHRMAKKSAYKEMKGSFSKFIAQSEPISYISYRLRWKYAPILKKVTSFPIHLDIETTNTCDLKCCMCPHSNPTKEFKASLGFMNYLLFETIIWKELSTA